MMARRTGGPQPPLTRVTAASWIRRIAPTAVELARQIAFVGAAVLLYFVVRGLTQGNVDDAVDNGLRLLRFERRLGVAWEAWAQGLILGRPLLVDLANWIYIWGHWPVIAATLIWLHHAHRRHYLLLRNAMFLSGAVGLVIFATYAVAPPRLLDVGLADTVTLHSTSYRVLQPPALVNKYAAMPSLHVGWNLLVGITLFRVARHWPLRVFAVASPVLMAVAVVVTANHYVLDGVAGAILSLAGLWASFRVTPRMVMLDRRLHHQLETLTGGPSPSAGAVTDLSTALTVIDLRDGGSGRHGGGEGDHQGGVVDDEAVDAPGREPVGRLPIGHRPGEDPPVPSLQLGHQAGGEEPAVDDDAVERHR
ncbi:MAG: phosphatase PAP2 family protein [Acidimicrobiales bacterium]